MKIYRVVIDSDGKTKKEPGTVTTEVVRTEMFFASDSIGDVFNAAIERAAIVDGDIVAVVEHCPAVTILSR